jgi:hygromycin-B 7''-O-kinase
VVADPLLDLARTDYHALGDNQTKRRAFLRGYGRLPPDWAARMALYRLHHALEFWNWSASTGKRTRLADIRTDLEKMISGDTTPQAVPRPAHHCRRPPPRVP